MCSLKGSRFFQGLLGGGADSIQSLAFWLIILRSGPDRASSTEELFCPRQTL